MRRRAQVVIVGGGISGLAAARQCARDGVQDMLLLEMADAAGGNSSCGENAVSAYPWAAHYVPLVRQDDAALMELFAGHGIISGFRDDLPVYDEYVLSADPQERLKILGQWQEGFIPVFGASPAEMADIQRFLALVEELKSRKGQDGRPVFAIPVDASSADPDWRRLDQQTFLQWIDAQGFRSPRLRWYLGYCCRDDFGARAADVSAWAGLHYFCARAGRAANADPGTVVTWPEGNGWFVRQWTRELSGRIAVDSLVHRVTPHQGGVDVDYLDARTQESVRVQADAAILAVPQFIARRLIPGTPAGLPQLDYSPWVTANVTVARRPGGLGMELAWDNVEYGAMTLGYVVATHQHGSSNTGATVLTCYWPLDAAAPAAERQRALARSHYDWQQIFGRELLRCNPDLEGQLLSMDVMPMGHAMVRPTPGTLWGATRRGALRCEPPLFRAHSDMSGISIFEEAFHRGRDAAIACRAWLDRARAAAVLR